MKLMVALAVALVMMQLAEGFLFGGGGGGGGGCGCGCKRKKRQSGFTPLEKTGATDDLTKHCNNFDLRKIIVDNVSDDVEASKLAIAEAASAKLGANFTVICSAGYFSFISYGDDYCLDGNELVTCYAFDH